MENNTVKKLSSPNGGICAICVLLCIFIITPVIWSVAGLGILKMSVTKESLKKAFMSDFTSKNDDAVGDMVSKMIDDGTIDFGDLDSDIAVDFSSDLMAGMLNYYITGEGQPIDKKEVIKYIEKNSDEFEDGLGVDIDDDFLEVVEEEIDDFNEYAEATEGNEFWNEEEMAPIRAILSAKVFAIAVGTLLFFVLLIFVLFNKYIDKSFAYLAVTYLVCGIFVLAAGILSKVGLTILAEDISSSSDPSDIVLVNILDNFSNNTLIVGGGIIGVSIIFFVLKSIFRNIRKNKEFGDTRSDLEKALEN